MTDDLLICIAWAMEGEIRGGPRIDRRFMLIHEYVAFGMTDLETGQFKWTVNRFTNRDEARIHALDLTAISENWGCTLTAVPHVREIRQSPQTTRRWLAALTSPDVGIAGLDATFSRTIRQGRSLDPSYMG